MTLIRLLVLVILLNVIRYLVGGILEGFLIFPWLFPAMGDLEGIFNTEFTSIDWITSYGYNFAMWLVIVWIFHLMRPVLRGGDVAASMKVFGIMWIFFAAVSAIYMNHYAHPKDFYIINIADALIVYPLTGLFNGLLYRRLMGRHAAPAPAGEAA